MRTVSRVQLMLLLLLFSTSLYCCKASPPPYEKPYDNTDLKIFIGRTFTDFVNTNCDKPEDVFIAAETWQTIADAQLFMIPHCKDFTTKYIKRTLYKDKAWKDKWKSEFEKPFRLVKDDDAQTLPDIDPYSEEYLNRIVIYISEAVVKEKGQ